MKNLIIGNWNRLIRLYCTRANMMTLGKTKQTQGCFQKWAAVKLVSTNPATNNDSLNKNKKRHNWLNSSSLSVGRKRHPWPHVTGFRSTWCIFNGCLHPSVLIQNEEDAEDGGIIWRRKCSYCYFKEAVSFSHSDHLLVFPSLPPPISLSISHPAERVERHLAPTSCCTSHLWRLSARQVFVKEERIFFTIKCNHLNSLTRRVTLHLTAGATSRSPETITSVVHERKKNQTTNQSPMKQQKYALFL